MNYELQNNIAIVTFDDGKANVVSPAFIDSINDALDRAENQKASAVILSGRDGMFSAGFDLGEFKKGPEAGLALVSKGMQLLIRLYSFPLPLIAACTGHGIAMGAFIIMACDNRIGTRGSYKITLPETAIGMEVPLTMLELTASRVPPQHITRVAIQAEVFEPDQAVAMGLLDEVVEAHELTSRALEIAEKLSQLPQSVYAANKLAVRRHALAAMNKECS
ncbi:putative enoyl-CoA hydratase [Halioglobus japonicus]|nr:putative enoyl-CoA hydratase [Halioglobus japonicus]